MKKDTRLGEVLSYEVPPDVNADKPLIAVHRGRSSPCKWFAPVPVTAYNCDTSVPSVNYSCNQKREAAS
jgi:hypothetical protein